MTFSGVHVDVINKTDGHSGKGTFRRFEDGQYKLLPISSRHSNVVKAVIIAKKSWGLHCKMWSDGIVEGTFTRREILYEFEKHGIEIPDSLKLEFENLIFKKIMKQ